VPNFIRLGQSHQGTRSHVPVTRRAPKGSRRAWMLAWPAAAVIGIANGVLREATYGKAVSERAAHQISGITAIAAFAVLFAGLEWRRPIASDADAVEIGVAWLALTIGFEFAFGRLVAKQSWRELFADYRVDQGRTWPFVLAWLATGPTVARRANRCSAT